MTLLLNRMWFHFHICVTGISPTCIWYIVCDGINRPGDLDLLTSKQIHELPVWGFHPASFTIFELDRGTRQTDRSREEDGVEECRVERNSARRDADDVLMF